MKTKLFLLLLLTSVVCFSQEQTKFRIDEKQKKELHKNGVVDVLMIELYLDGNEKSLSKDKHPALSNPSNYLESVKKKSAANKRLFKDICVECYEMEYASQQKMLDSIKNAQNESFKRESEEREKKRLAEKRGRDSIYNASFKKNNSNPYDRFRSAMSQLSQNSGLNYPTFTVFTNMDEELVRMVFSLYLQSIGYTYSEDSEIGVKKNTITERYIPKVRANNNSDFFKVTYYIHEDKDLPSYNQTIIGEYVPCYIVDRVVIDGNINSIMNLYFDYWRLTRKTFENDKTGEIAQHIFMGDHISLQVISKNKWRIEITKQGGVGMDYYTLYKILESYNESIKNGSPN